MVGFRVFDVGLLLLWLVWFFRLRDDDAGSSDEGDDDDGGGPPVHPPGPSGGGGLGLVLPGRPARRSPAARPHASGEAPVRAVAASRFGSPQPARVRRSPRPVRVR